MLGREFAGEVGAGRRGVGAEVGQCRRVRAFTVWAAAQTGATRHRVCDTDPARSKLAAALAAAQAVQSTKDAPLGAVLADRPPFIAIVDTSGRGPRSKERSRSPIAERASCWWGCNAGCARSTWDVSPGTDFALLRTHAHVCTRT